jgi:ribosome-associated translation inhibitor RaiA
MVPIKIEFRGGADGRSIRARVAARVADVVEALPVRATSVRATFTDENGAKGGDALRCALEVRLPRRPAIHVEEVAATPRLAFDGALARLERQAGRLVDTTRELSRRPKKYFAARRALTS